MHVVLIERQFTGHRPTYLYQYSKLLIDLGHQVSIICGEAQKCSEFINIEKQLVTVDVIALSKIRRTNIFLSRLSFYSSYVYWKRLKSSLKNIQNPDFAFFMYFDDFVFNFHFKHVNRIKVNVFLNKYILSIFIDNCLHVKWSGILFHPVYYNHIDFSYLFRSKYNSSLAVLDETCDLNLEIKKKFVLPDITDEQDPGIISELTREILKKANGRKIISLLGSLEKRKGILPLLQVAREIDNNKYFFLIAGQLAGAYSEDEKSYIQNARQMDNCYMALEGIPTEYDFNSLVKISDILYVVYIDFFHSSNILTKAGLFEKPVLSLQDYCIGKRVEKYNLGITISAPGVPEIRKALENFDLLFDWSKSKFKEYFLMHSQTSLKQSLKGILEN